MKRFLDLSQVPTAELCEIRNVLKFGAKAYASKAGDEVRKLREVNAQLKREKEIRETVISYDLDFDSDPEYWKRLDSEGVLEFVCKKIAYAKKVANAESKPTMKIPPIIGFKELSTLDTVREALRNRKNGGEVK